MARFRKIDPRIWNDAKFAALSSEAKLLFLYLLTSPAMTILGALPIRASAVAEELGLDPKRYAIRYEELSQQGMVEYDDRGLFWIRNYLKYNGPDNPKVVISWSSSLDLLPECPLLENVLEAARNHCLARGESFAKAFEDSIENRYANGMAYGMPYKEKEKEKEKNITREARKPFSASKVPTSNVPTFDAPTSEVPTSNATRVPTSDVGTPPTSDVGRRNQIRNQIRNNKRATKVALNFYGVSEQIVEDWKANRKAKRAVISQSVIDGLKKKADEARRLGHPEWNLEAIMREQVARAWQGFELSWVLKEDKQQKLPPLELTPEAKARRRAEALRAQRQDEEDDQPGVFEDLVGQVWEEVRRAPG